jgi:hypothetical protein
MGGGGGGGGGGGPGGAATPDPPPPPQAARPAAKKAMINPERIVDTGFFFIIWIATGYCLLSQWVRYEYRKVQSGRQIALN